MNVKIAANGREVAARCVVAASMRARMVGLLNHDSLPAGEGMLLDPCNNVHTFFMRFAIDVVFLGKDNTVLAIDELRPWRISRLRLRARKVLELPLGACRAVGLKPGDRLEFTPCSS